MKRLAKIFMLSLLLYTRSFAATKHPGFAMSPILMLLSFFVVFYFLFMRPQMKRNKDQRKMLSQITKGDEVVTTGGVVGKIVKVGMNYHELEISDNVIINVQKNAVSSILPKGAMKTN